MRAAAAVRIGDPVSCRGAPASAPGRPGHRRPRRQHDVRSPWPGQAYPDTPGRGRPCMPTAPDPGTVPGLRLQHAPRRAETASGAGCRDERGGPGTLHRQLVTCPGRRSGARAVRCSWRGHGVTRDRMGDRQAGPAMLPGSDRAVPARTLTKAARGHLRTSPAACAPPGRPGDQGRLVIGRAMPSCSSGPASRGTASRPRSADPGREGCDVPTCR
jgi:hypothetical protein